MRVIEAHLRRSSAASAQARFGAVSFIQRFGSSLNRHLHDHRCVIEGVFEPLEQDANTTGSRRFLPAAELTADDLAILAVARRGDRIWAGS